MERVFIKTERELIDEFGSGWQYGVPGWANGMRSLYGRDITDYLKYTSVEQVVKDINSQDYESIFSLSGLGGWAIATRWCRVGNMTTQENKVYKVKQNGLFSI